MFPKTKKSEKVHRRKKRNMEISSVLQILSRLFKEGKDPVNNSITILEFGSGDGFQIPHLKKIGNLVASDTYTGNDIRNMKDVSFIECSITDAPFKNSQFDLIFSNHVIEHLEDKKKAFDELKRIGKTDCVYAFSVPTNIWLLLSIPAQYYNKIRSISEKLLNINSKEMKKKSEEDNRIDRGNNNVKAKSTIKKIVQIIIPTGHGSDSSFISCYGSFRVKNWSRLFTYNGFSVIKRQPLLLYGPSEWPIIPTTRVFNRFYFCSSILFLLKSNESHRKKTE